MEYMWKPLPIVFDGNLHNSLYGVDLNPCCRKKRRIELTWIPLRVAWMQISPTGWRYPHPKPQHTRWPKSERGRGGGVHKHGVQGKKFIFSEWHCHYDISCQVDEYILPSADKTLESSGSNLFPSRSIRRINRNGFIALYYYYVNVRLS